MNAYTSMCIGAGLLWFPSSPAFAQPDGTPHDQAEAEMDRPDLMLEISLGGNVLLGAGNFRIGAIASDRVSVLTGLTLSYVRENSYDYDNPDATTDHVTVAVPLELKLRLVDPSPGSVVPTARLGVRVQYATWTRDLGAVGALSLGGTSDVLDDAHRWTASASGMLGAEYWISAAVAVGAEAGLRYVRELGNETDPRARHRRLLTEAQLGLSFAL